MPLVHGNGSRSFPIRRSGREGIVPLSAYLGTMFWKRVLYYLNPATMFKAPDPNMSLRFMHGINRISVFVFLFCLIVMVVRACGR